MKSMELLAALRRSAESEEIDANGDTWGLVYLDNARPDDMAPRAFAGYLAALKFSGLYRPYDHEAFGWVKVAS